MASVAFGSAVALFCFVLGFRFPVAIIGVIARKLAQTAESRLIWVKRIQGDSRNMFAQRGLMNVRTQVQCHKVRGEEVPSGFRMGTEFLHVRRVIGSWEKDDIRYFKVATLDGRVFLLGLDTFTGRWELERRATSNPDGGRRRNLGVPRARARANQP